MASVEQYLFSFLQSKTALTALIGTKLYPQRAPQKTNPPYIRYSLISESPNHSHDVQADLTRVMDFQFSIFATSYQAAATIRDVLITALNGVHRTVTIGSPPTTATLAAQHTNSVAFYEEDTEIHHIAVDFTVWCR